MSQQKHFLLSLSVGIAATLFGCISFAQTKKNIAYVNPNMDTPIAVVGKDKKKVVTRLLPGQMVTIEETTPDGWIRIKANDQSGNPTELYLEKKASEVGPNGANMSIASPEDLKQFTEFDEETTADLYKRPGGNKIECLIEGCTTISSGKGAVIEETVLQLSIDENTAKPKWQNYYKINKGWINDQFMTSIEKESPAPKNEICDPNDPKSPVDKNTLNDFKNIQTKTSELATNLQLPKVLEHVGECRPFTQEWNRYEKKIAPIMEQKFKAGTLPKLKKEVLKDGKLVTTDAKLEDWVAIDVMARTLYGEMASCFSKGEQYPKTVAKLIANRAEFAEEPQNAKRKSLFVSSSNTEAKSSLTNVMLMKFQFSMWNPTDRAGIVAMCPPVSENAPYMMGNKKPNKNEVSVWEKAVKIASDVVLRGPTFKAATQDMKSLYYTSNLDEEKFSARGFHLQKNTTIGGQQIKNSSCLQVWKAKDVDWKPKSI